MAERKVDPPVYDPGSGLGHYGKYNTMLLLITGQRLT